MSKYLLACLMLVLPIMTVGCNLPANISCTISTPVSLNCSYGGLPVAVAIPQDKAYTLDLITARIGLDGKAHMQGITAKEAENYQAHIDTKHKLVYITNTKTDETVSYPLPKPVKQQPQQPQSQQQDSDDEDIMSL